MGPLRSLEVSPLDRAQIVTMALSHVVSEIFNVEKNVMTLKLGSEVTQGHSSGTIR